MIPACQRLPHDVAMPVDHLRHESIHHVALQVHPFHVQGLVLRLAVAGNGHHVTQCDRMLARIIVSPSPGVGKNSATVNGCRRATVARYFLKSHITGNRLAQRLVIQHTACDQRALNGPVFETRSNEPTWAMRPISSVRTGTIPRMRWALVAGPVDIGRAKPPGGLPWPEPPP